MYIYILIGLLSFLISMAAYGLNGGYYEIGSREGSMSGRGMLEIIKDIWSA
jgi:hypothetical protein